MLCHTDAEAVEAVEAVEAAQSKAATILYSAAVSDYNLNNQSINQLKITIMEQLAVKDGYQVTQKVGTLKVALYALPVLGKLSYTFTMEIIGQNGESFTQPITRKEYKTLLANLNETV